MDKKTLLMEKLGCSEVEALDIIACDKAIDKGEKMDFDLSKEQQKIAKKMTSTGTRAKGSSGPRERKENPTKALVIDEIFKFLCGNEVISAENLQILNKERQIAFKIGEKSFELTLTQKRK